MRTVIRVFEAGNSTAEVIEYTNDDTAYLYTVIYDSDELKLPVVESYNVELGESPSVAKHKAIGSFNQVVTEFLALHI